MDYGVTVTKLPYTEMDISLAYSGGQFHSVRASRLGDSANSEPTAAIPQERGTVSVANPWTCSQEREPMKQSTIRPNRALRAKSMRANHGDSVD